VSRRLRRNEAHSDSIGSEVAVLDREHLSHQTMESDELAGEIVGLFLTQLPAILDMLKTAASAADWKLAVHTLKGSAVTVGAMRIAAIAAALEKLTAGDSPAKHRLIAALDVETAAFREAARRL
jgi:HPt (histidine-containing phosphotransfer) domain-containing protein